MKKLLISGPIFNTPSGPSGQGGKLYLQLKTEGFEVTKRSFYRNKLLRTIDTLSFVLLKKKKYDIVILQLFSFQAFVLEYMVLLFSKFLGKKSIVIIRGGAFIEFFNNYPNWCTQALNQCDELLTPSHFIRQILLAKGFKVNYIPNFIDNGLFMPGWQPKSTFKLLWVRSFHDIYKPEMAIRAIQYLQSHFDISLTMIGPDQGKLDYCQQLIQELNLENRIDIKGYISNDLLQEYYHSHSVYINTTTYESFGVALIEAASCGIPIVSTNAGEIPFMWRNEEEMLIVPDHHQDAFNLAIQKLLNDTQLQLKLSENARKKASEYTWRFVRQSWLNLINTI